MDFSADVEWNVTPDRGGYDLLCFVDLDACTEEEDGFDAEPDRLHFHVRFDANGSYQEAYALLSSSGADIPIDYDGYHERLAGYFEHREAASLKKSVSRGSDNNSLGL